MQWSGKRRRAEGTVCEVCMLDEVWRLGSVGHRMQDCTLAGKEEHKERWELLKEFWLALRKNDASKKASTSKKARRVGASSADAGHAVDAGNVVAGDDASALAVRDMQCKLNSSGQGSASEFDKYMRTCLLHLNVEGLVHEKQQCDQDMGFLVNTPVPQLSREQRFFKTFIDTHVYMVSELAGNGEPTDMVWFGSG